jgi:hypothetical protein
MNLPMKWNDYMKFVSIYCIFLLLLSACSVGNEKEPTKKSTPLNVSVKKEEEKATISKNKIVEKAEKIILNYEEVTSAVAVHHERELIVAFNIEKMEEFHVKEIEKRVKKRLNKEFPHEKISVSHDLKIFMELQKLIKEEQKLTHKNIKKRMSEISKLAEEKA